MPAVPAVPEALAASRSSPTLHTELHARLQTAIEAAGAHREDATACVAQVMQAATSLAHAAELSPHQVLMSALAAHGAQPEALIAFFHAMPGNELVAASKVDLALCPQVQPIASHVLAQRAQAAQKAYNTYMGELTNWRWNPETGAMDQPDRFAFALIEAGSHFKDFQFLSGSALGPVQPLAQRREVTEMIGRFCTSGNLCERSSHGCTPVQLKGVLAVLPSLGLAEFTDSVEGELASRRDGGSAGHVKLSLDVLHAVNDFAREPNVEGVLTVLRRVAGDRAMLPSAQKELLAHELRSAVEGLKPDERAALERALMDPLMRQLPVALREIRRSAVCQPERVIRRELQQIEGELTLLRKAVFAQADPAASELDVISSFAALPPAITTALGRYSPLMERVMWSMNTGKTYLRPLTAGEATAANADPALARDFLAFVLREHSGENFLFMQALNRWGQQPDLKTAGEIVEKFVKEGAPRQINLNADMRKAIEKALREPSLDPLETLRVAFEVARTEINTLITRDTLPRFSKSLIASASRTPVPPPTMEAPRPIGNLAAVWAGADSLEQAAAKLEALVPPPQATGLLGRATRADWTKHWDHFYDAVLIITAECLTPAQLVSLLYNIDSVLSPQSREKEEVFWLRAAAADALIGSREARMTPESVLLGAAVNDMDLGVIADWLDRGRISEEQVAEAFIHLPDERLNLMDNRSEHDQRLVFIAEGVRAARTAAVGSGVVGERDIDVKEARPRAPHLTGGSASPLSP